MNSTQLFPRTKFRPRIRVVPLIMGVVMGIGGFILGQQFGVIIPSRAAAINMIVGGPILGLVLNNVGRAISVMRMNKQITQAENSLPEDSDDAAPTGPIDAGWAATHRVPSGGMQAWPEPDPSKTATDLAEGVEVVVKESRGDWALVAASNGWEGWVDARGLEKI